MDSTYISFLFLVSVFIFIIEAPASFDWTADGDHRSPGIHNTVVLSTITRHLISSSPRQIYNYIRHMEISSKRCFHRGVLIDYEKLYDKFNLFLEEAQPAIVRAICSTNRPFFMSVFDKTSNNKILEFERLMKCCSPILFPSSRATIVVRDRRAQILGFVKHA